MFRDWVKRDSEIILKRNEKAMKNKRVMKLASRGKRFGAYCIDAIVPVFNLLLMFITIGIISARSGRRYGYGNGFGYGWDDDFGGGFGNGYGL